MPVQYFPRGRIPLEELHPVNNADVFDTDLMQGQDRGNGSKSTGFVCNFNIDRIGFLDWSAGSINKGIAVASCFIKKMIKRITACMINFCFDPVKGINITAKQG